MSMTSLIASWSTMSAMRSGSKMIVENSPVGSLKSNGIAVRAIHSVQGMTRTIRSDIEGRWGVKIDVTHSIWPWIAEHAGFWLTRFEVGRGGKTAYERLKGKSAKVQWNRNTRVVRRKPATERWDRRNFESEVVTMDKEYREKLETEEHVPVPKRVFTSRENLEEFGFTARWPGCMSLLRGTARQAHTENRRRWVEAELKGTAKEEAAMRRIKEYQDRTAERGTKRTKTSQEEGRQQYETEEPTARIDEDTLVSSSSGSGLRSTSTEFEQQLRHDEDEPS